MTAAIPMGEYRAVDAESFSSLKHLLDSPRAYLRQRVTPTDETDAMRLGSATHTAVLEPDRFPIEYVLWDGGVRRGKAWDAFSAANASKTILTEAQYTECLAVRDAVRGHPVASKLLAEGKAEVSVRWTHRGMHLKGRVDWLGQALIDLKTTRDPSPRAFLADAYRRRYPMQLAMYSDAVAIVLRQAPPVYIIAAQNCEPYDVAVYAVGDDILSHGREQYERAVDLLQECRASGAWPGIAEDGAIPFELPRWADAVTEADDGLAF